MVNGENWKVGNIQYRCSPQLIGTVLQGLPYTRGRMQLTALLKTL